MFKSQKNAFWQALLVTLLVFSLGVIMGVVLENWRNAKVKDLYQKSEVDMLDIRLQSLLYTEGVIDCQSAIGENIKFADKIYKEARILERYEQASVLTKDLRLQHKKYDILRAILYFNSLTIKQKCNSSYHDVVYFYRYNNPSADLKAKESVFSKLLGELKEEYGDNMLLIPMAADNNITSIDLLLDIYDITYDDLPLILIDQEIKITEIQNLKEVEKYLK